MKNCIWKGLCIFFMLFSVISLFVPIAFSAQNGHGGSTEVIARIEAETEQTSEAQPFPTNPEPSDSSPVQTGELIAWYAFVFLFVFGGTLVLAWIKNRSEH